MICSSWTAIGVFAGDWRDSVSIGSFSAGVVLLLVALVLSCVCWCVFPLV